MYAFFHRAISDRFILFGLLGYFFLLSWHITSYGSTEEESPVKAQLIAEVKSIQSGKSFWVALRLQMDEHWHTYWQNPGDAGLPTTIEWDLPEGFVAGEILWPFPQRIEEPPLVTFGYEGEVLLLNEIRAPKILKPGLSVKIKARAEWLMCKESCIPGSAELLIKLPVVEKNPEIDLAMAELFKIGRMRLPKFIPGWKVKASIDDENIIIQILSLSNSAKELESISFFPILPGLVNYNEAVSTQRIDDSYFLTIPRSRVIKKLPKRLKGVLYTEAGWNSPEGDRALAIDVPLQRKK